MNSKENHHTGCWPLLLVLALAACGTKPRG